MSCVSEVDVPKKNCRLGVSEIELPYLKDPGGVFRLRYLSLSLSLSLELYLFYSRSRALQDRRNPDYIQARPNS